MASERAGSLHSACVFAAGVALGGVAAYAAARSLHAQRAHATAQSSAPPEVASSEPVRGACCGVSLDDEIVGEQLTRNVQFFGRERQQRVVDSFVVVVGLGVRRLRLPDSCWLSRTSNAWTRCSQGVGSHAAHMLLRSGVGKLRLIDFDQVTLSSLNRHAVATRADVGTPKALALARHFREIAPETPVDARVAMFEEARRFSRHNTCRSGLKPALPAQAAAEELLGGSPSCVLDCIDNIDTKVALLAACHRRVIPVLSVAGAGGKADPTRLHIASLADSVRDPLARAVRHKLRRRHGRDVSVPVLFSSEPPRCGLLEADTNGGALTPADLQLLPGFRVRTIPVLGTSPALFGCAAAAWALCSLAGQPICGAPPISMAPEQVMQQHERLCEREHLRFGSDAGAQVDAQDVAYVMAELWACRSARHGLGEGANVAPPSNSRKAVFRSTQQLVLTRWDAAKPAAVDNLVLLTFDEADAHDATSLEAVRAALPAWARHVEGVLARAARDHGLI